MVRLREIPRTAAFAWSPGTTSPFLATGTRAGAVNDSFSDDTQLELWDLSLDTAGQGVELQPTASVTSDSRFHDVAWVQPKEGKEKGIIAGALENGSLDLWDAARLLNNDSDSKISSTQKHTGPIKALQFNPFRSELLATAGAKEELYISDLNSIGNPFKLGNTAATATDFECLDWNKKVPHIMATGSSGGFVTVWDVKSKKQNLTLNNYGRKPVSAVAWDPEKPTRLITAVPLETDPVILVWDLRNANAPERVLTGHQGGVLSLSWCPQDPDLLLSCGKDNRTLVWNPQTGEQYGEFPVVTNWTFQTRWNPHNPSLLATASFDGKIGVHTIQSTKTEVTDSAGAPVSDEDFFASTQNQPQGSSFNLKKAPKWLERPTGAAFGFGGKVVSFKPDATGKKSVIKISKFTIDEDVGKLAETFEGTLADKDLNALCESRITEAKTEGDKADWKVMETLVSSNPRKELINYLGFAETTEAAAPATNGDAAAEKADDDESFFDKPADNDGFLTDIAATKGNKTNNPFHLYSDSESDVNKSITKAVMLGQFDKALDICLAEDRLSDAFMIATCGGPTSIEKVQKAYFKKQGSGPQYTRLLASVVGKNLWDVVYNADIANWKETMVAICTYADSKEFPDLCEALGDRLDEQLTQSPTDATLRQNAAFCYMTGSKLEKVVGLWLTDLANDEKKGLEEATDGTAFSIHARSLQNFVEKVTVFREVTKYQDGDLQAPSDWKLADLYDKYLEYADIAASHGQLTIAKKYLDLLPAQYANADVARNRVLLATQKTPVTTAAKQPSAAARTQPNVVPAFETTPAPYQPAQRQTGYGAPQALGPYAPTGAGARTQPSSSYAPTASPYSPAGPYTPSQPMQQPGRPNVGMPPQPNTFMAPVAPHPAAFGGPPRGGSPAIPPPSQAKNMVNWNDTPDDFFKAPTASRRGTPAAQAPAYPSQYSNAPPTMSSPPMAGMAPPPKGPGAGPPPRGPGPPPRTGTPSSAYTPVERPGSVSAASSAYAPQAPQQPQSTISAPMAPPIARGPSPYQPPPSAAGGAGGSRYAPSPVAQLQAQAPPPAGPPQPNPYAPRQSSLSSAQYSAPTSAAPPPRAGPPMGGPPQGPPRSMGTPVQAQAPPRAVAPPSAQYPSGDREHIPDNARPIFNLLSEDMARVKAKAPANFKPQVLDTEKRLNILFDNLNNGTLLKGNTIDDMAQLSQALQAKDYEKAGSIQVNIMTHRTEECGQWMVGVKRLIAMSRATP